MTDEESLSKGFIQAVRVIMRGSLIVEGTITAVDTSTDPNTGYTCTVQVGPSEADSATYYQVPLKVLMGSQASFIEIPAVNSNCLLSFRDANLGRPQLISVDNVDDIHINVNNKVTFNGGQLGGLIKISPLLSALNTVQNDLNTLKQDFTTWSPVPNDGGAALKAATAAWAGQQITVTQQSDIEDTTIVH